MFCFFVGEGLVDSYSVKMSSMKQNKCGAPPQPFNRINKVSGDELFLDLCMFVCSAFEPLYCS